MTFKLTQEQIKTIQEVFDKQSPGNGNYDCWEGINKQLQSIDESDIPINEEGKEEIQIFYMEKRGESYPIPNMAFSLHKVKVHRD
jgi:hypothetical protein